MLTRIFLKICLAVLRSWHNCVSSEGRSVTQAPGSSTAVFLHLASPQGARRTEELIAGWNAAAKRRETSLMTDTGDLGMAAPISSLAFCGDALETTERRLDRKGSSRRPRNGPRCSGPFAVFRREQGTGAPAARVQGLARENHH